MNEAWPLVPFNPSFVDLSHIRLRLRDRMRVCVQSETESNDSSTEGSAVEPRRENLVHCDRTRPETVAAVGLEERQGHQSQRPSRL